MTTILMIEDKESMADMLSKTLKLEGYAVKTASKVSDGISLLCTGDIDAVITDLRLPDGDGMEIVRAVKERLPLVPVIVMTAFATIEIAVKAVKEGAYDFITKPFDVDHLVLIMKRALSEKVVQRENLVMKEEFSQFLTMPEIVGVSLPWREVMEKVKKVAPLKTTVLILGESGAGKEVIARAIHHMSPRSRQPFVAVNCAAIPSDLIENELFGHEKGAFTGAHEIKPGRFELADRGTVFLDEIGDMAMPLQSKLLRVLQENEFERVGGTKSLRVDSRVLAASNKNLDKEVSEGRFREDLLYRLNVFPILVPPLRERREDIVPLTRHFVTHFSREMNKAAPSISPEVDQILASYTWKGNIRELKNVIERAVILCDGAVLLRGHLNFGKEMLHEKLSLDAPLHEVVNSAVRTAEKGLIEDALRKARGNRSKAAEMLKVSYKTLLNKIKEYGISVIP